MKARIRITIEKGMVVKVQRGGPIPTIITVIDNDVRDEKGKPVKDIYER